MRPRRSKEPGSRGIDGAGAKGTRGNLEVREREIDKCGKARRTRALMTDLKASTDTRSKAIDEFATEVERREPRPRRPPKRPSAREGPQEPGAGAQGAGKSREGRGSNREEEGTQPGRRNSRNKRPIERQSKANSETAARRTFARRLPRAHVSQQERQKHVPRWRYMPLRGKRFAKTSCARAFRPCSLWTGARVRLLFREFCARALRSLLPRRFDPPLLELFFPRLERLLQLLRSFSGAGPLRRPARPWPHAAQLGCKFVDRLDRVSWTP